MHRDQTFKLGTALARGLRELLERLEDRLQLKSPLQVYLAGGMAVHLYTGKRVTGDVDAEFGGRVLLPSDLVMRAIEARATEALGGYVGGVEMLKANLRDTIAIAREAETRRAQDKPADGGRHYPPDVV